MSPVRHGCTERLRSAEHNSFATVLSLAAFIRKSSFVTVIKFSNMIDLILNSALNLRMEFIDKIEELLKIDLKLVHEPIRELY